MNVSWRGPEQKRPLLLLGEQRDQSSLQAALDRWQVTGPVGLICAGWEEDEEDANWVQAAVNVPVVNSRLYGLAEELFAEDPEVLSLLRQRQDRLRVLREVNQLQVRHLTAIARELLNRDDPHLHRPSLDLVFRQLRETDDLYLDEVTRVIQEFDELIAPKSRASVLRYRERVIERLANCEVLLIAGGHVGVLLNRLKLSRLLSHLPQPVIAWSGGAMALGSRVYFFHQFLPHATGELELSRRGMGWYDGLQLFPRYDERLNLLNRNEMQILAQRISGAALLMDRFSRLEWDATGTFQRANIQQLRANGTVEEWHA